MTRQIFQQLAAAFLATAALVPVEGNEVVRAVPLAKVRLLPSMFQARQNLPRQVTLSYGDTIELCLPISVRVRPAIDDSQWVSFFCGPVLLAGAPGREAMPPRDEASSFDKLPTQPVPKLVFLAPSALKPVSGQLLQFFARIVSPNQSPEILFKPILRSAPRTLYDLLAN